MQVEVDGHSTTVNGTQMIVELDSEQHGERENVDEPNQDTIDPEKQLTHEDILLLCDLFYLPFEHGGQGIQLLQEFNWLKSNAHIVMHKSKEDKTNNKADVRIRSLLYAVILLIV